MVMKYKVVPNKVFVFGSNLGGYHGSGAAAFARLHHGAIMGVAEGRTGNAYAIPTKEIGYQTSRKLPDIQESVNRFIKYAQDHPDEEFLVTRVGCGLAGYTDEQIGPMFKNAPDNCELPAEWGAFR
jgi:predicted esterase YcpF (UPF0227 family)